MTISAPETLHATCVMIGDRAVLITGPSGSGKSDLALRLIDRGATLVSDDYTIVHARDDALFASAPTTITGLIEVRGVGLVPMPFANNVRVALLVTLSDEVARFPEDDRTCVIAGIVIAKYDISAFEASAPVKVELIMKTRRLI